MIEPLGRPAGDILSRSVRLKFGGTEYVLPVLTIGGNRRWQEKLDQELSGVLTRLRRAGNRSPQLLEALAGQLDAMVDLVLEYDTSHVLPPKDELIDMTYEDELIAAVQEVWRAANPLVAMAVDRLRAQMTVPPTNDSSEPTSSPPPSGAGRRRKSKTN